MRDVAQTIAHEAYRGDSKALFVGAVVTVVCVSVWIFIIWFKEYVKKG